LIADAAIDGFERPAQTRGGVGLLVREERCEDAIEAARVERGEDEVARLPSMRVPSGARRKRLTPGHVQQFPDSREEREAAWERRDSRTRGDMLIFMMNEAQRIRSPSSRS